MASGSGSQLCTRARSCVPAATASTASQGSISSGRRTTSGAVVAKAADGAHDDPAVRRGEGREAHRADRLTAGPVEARLESLHVREQGPRRLRERAAGLGEQHAATLPLEQLHPRLGLEALDLLGHRARGVVERGRGGADGAVRLDGDERAQRDRIDHAAMLHSHGHDSLMDVNGRAAPTMRHMRRRDTALAVLVALIWGTNFVAIRTGIDSVPPFLFLAVRFVVVCVPAVFLVRRPGLPWRDLALIGLFTSLGQFALMYLALHLGMPPGLAVARAPGAGAAHRRHRGRLAARASVHGAAPRRRPGRSRTADDRGRSRAVGAAAPSRRARAGRRVVGRRQRADPPGGGAHGSGRRARGHGLVGARRAGAGPRPLVRLRGADGHRGGPAPPPVAGRRLDRLHGLPLLARRLRDLEHPAQPPPRGEGDAVRDARAGLRHGRGRGRVRRAAQRPRAGRRARAARRCRRSGDPPHVAV